MTIFVQYAQFKGEPAQVQGAMAHAGPYPAGDNFIHLVAEQTISTAPSKILPLTYPGLTEHDVDVRRVNDELTLTFKGSGTVQIFELAGPGEGKVYKLETVHWPASNWALPSKVISAGARNTVVCKSTRQGD